MEQEKNNYSDTSTAESEAEKPNEERAARSYDCGFCKRGFTNAQALGGHMNIHRKDKAKANKKNHEKPLIQTFNSNHSFTSPHQIDHVFRGHVGGYQVANPYEYCFFPVWRPDNLEDRIDGNLGLMIGDVEDEEDVDLELRLG